MIIEINRHYNILPPFGVETQNIASALDHIEWLLRSADGEIPRIIIDIQSDYEKEKSQ